MKNVEFRRVFLQNFCSHIDPVEVEFENNSLTVITGPNGAGKTAIFEALPYALYGRCNKGTGEDVLNDKTGKNCRICVDFDIDDIPYRVEKYVKFTKYGTTVLLFKDNEKEAYKKGHKEVVPEIEKLLVPRTLFMNTLLFSQKVKAFFTDLTDTEQKEIFRKILTLDEYLLYQKETNKRLELVADTITELKNELEVTKGLTEDSVHRILELKQKMEEFKKQKVIQLKDLNEKLLKFIEIEKTYENEYQTYLSKDFRSQLELCNKDLTITIQKLESLDKIIQLKITEIESAKKIKENEFHSKSVEIKSGIAENREKHIKSLKEPFEKEKEKIQTYINDMNSRQLVIRNSCSNINKDGERIQKELKKFRDVLELDNVICPTCLQSLENPETLNTHIKELEEELEELRPKRDELEKEHKTLSDKIGNLNKDMSDLLRDFTKSEEQIIVDSANEEQDIDNRFVSAVSQLYSAADKQIKKIKIENTEEEKRLLYEQQELNRKKRNIEEHLEKQKECELKVLECQQNIDFIKNEIESKEEEEFDKSMLESYLLKKKGLEQKFRDIGKEILKQQKLEKILEFWKVGFSTTGIQSMLIDEAIPYINQQVAYYLDQLSGGRYVVSFDTLKETKGGEFRDKISVNVYDNVTHANSRVKISGGQERIVDIATILSLCDLQTRIQDMKFNLLLFDEIFDALDDENIGYVSKLLRQVSKDKSVFIITHRHIDNLEADLTLELH